MTSAPPAGPSSVRSGGGTPKLPPILQRAPLPRRELVGTTIRISARRSPLPPPLLREAALAQADLAAAGRAGRDAHPHRAGGRLDVRLAAQRRLRTGRRDGGLDVRAVDLEARIRLDLHLRAADRPPPPGALAGEADLLARAHPCGDLHRERPAARPCSVSERAISRLPPLDRLLDGEGSVASAVGTLLRRRTLLPELAAEAGRAARRAAGRRPRRRRTACRRSAEPPRRRRAPPRSPKSKSTPS